MTCRYPFLDCEGCDQCATPAITISPVNRAMTAEQRKADRVALLAVGVVVFTVSLIGLAVAASYGPVKSEQQFQYDLRR